MITVTENPSRSVTLKQVLLFSGIVSSVWYVMVNIYVPTQYEGYSMASLTVSELSAIGAPTRKLWVTLVVLYPLLFATFGWGVLESAGPNKALRAVGWLIIGYSLLNIYWPPMHQRGTETSLTDTLHLVWAGITVVLMIVMMTVGSTAFGKSFQTYTIASIGAHILFGLLTGLEAPDIPTNGLTPTIGIWERINIGVFMLWVIVLSLNLLRSQNIKTQ